MNRSRPGRRRNRVVLHFMRICLLGTMVTVAGCLPVPYPPMGVNMITEETLQAIQPNLSTRSDVLLLLADPTVRGDEDAYFIYEWTQGHGGLIFIAGGGYTAGPLASVGSSSCNGFAIKFSPDGRVARTSKFSSKAKIAGTIMLGKDAELVGSACGDPVMSAAIRAWLEMGPEHAP